MRFGPLIKFYRTQKGMTQKELANGICSVPHLSKIEANTKEANQETIGLLLERLGVNIQSLSENEEQIGPLISELNEKIDYYLNEEADRAMQKLEGYEKIIPFTSYLHTYELSKYRYMLFKGWLKDAEKQFELLNKQKKIFSQPQQSLFCYLHAVELLKKGSYKKADELMSTIGKKTKIDISRGELLYHRALAKSSLEEPGFAIHYGRLALQAFMEDYNFVRILHALMLLGINYTHSKIYDEALDCFEHLIRNAEIMKEQLLPEIYHNMGYLKKKLQNTEEAISYFEKSLSIQSQNTSHYLITLYSLGELYVETENIEKAHQAFNELLKLAKELNNRKYRILANYHLMAFDSPEKSLVYSERKVIPFLEESEGNSEDLIGFYKLVSNHYRKIGRYDQAVKYIEKIN
ncbi:tetratricopeptide repeat protein [Bacillus sp. REN3]|uniref:tetratricopeptide repeat protein n=1 Tax=Bacillus sp. REN3 TaxID=2802440 RepID=UPI001AED8BBF|nr:tetratricopeptide repeat protein [Bacillus sp. REN3]